MSGGWDSKQDYDEGRAVQHQLEEEMARIRRDGLPLEFDIEQQGGRIVVLVAGCSELRLTPNQARLLGSALLAEVEIAQRGEEIE